MAEAAEDLNGTEGMIFRADLENQTFELLKETVIDPKTDEGRSRHTIYWNDDTMFVRVDRQNSFEALEGRLIADFPQLGGDALDAAMQGEDFVTLNATIFRNQADAQAWGRQTQGVLWVFEPDPNADKFRQGSIMINRDQSVQVRLRGPRAKVDIRTVSDATLLQDGFWATTIFGERDEHGRFVASRIDLDPKVDPRTTDDPNLPRVLVIGDSISMNYHDAAKKALHGIANYHRIEGNGGPSNRGVTCVELWLGDYNQPGLQWDVIQFNHGLHDLKQLYDPETQTYGDYQLDLESYKANLDKIIAMLKQTGATLMWCSTTPVPSSSVGVWGGITMGRQHGVDLIFNEAAMQVLANHPDILVNDLNSAIREADGFETWWQGKDVHFWHETEQQIVGRAVAEEIKRALMVHTERQAASPKVP